MRRFSNFKIRTIISVLLTFIIIVSATLPSSAATKETKKYKSLPANQGLVENGRYQDNYKDYEYTVTIKIKKKNTTIKLIEYAGGPYIAEYTSVDGKTKKVGKKKNTKYSYRINVFHTYGKKITVGNVFLHPHTKKITFKKPGTYTFTVNFWMKNVLFPIDNVYRYVDDKYPKWSFKYDNKRVQSVSVILRPIERY